MDTLSGATAASSELDIAQWPSERLSDWVLSLVHSAKTDGVLNDHESIFASHFFSGRRFRVAHSTHDRMASAMALIPLAAAHQSHAPPALCASHGVRRALTASLGQPLPSKVRSMVDELLRLLRRPVMREFLYSYDHIREQVQAKAPPLEEGLEAALTRLPVPPRTPIAHRRGCEIAENSSLPTIQREGQHRLVMVRRDDKPLVSCAALRCPFLSLERFEPPAFGSISSLRTRSATAHLHVLRAQ